MKSEIRYSRGTNTFDAYPTQRTAPDFDSFEKKFLDDRSKKKGQTYVCAAFKVNGTEKAHRCKDDALPSTFIPFDFDGMDGLVVHEHLVQDLSQYRGFGYTTSSHTEESPRMRAVLAASREMTRTERQRVCKAIQKLIQAHPWAKSVKFDESVYRAEQPLYTPLENAEIYHFDGDVVDVDEVLKTAPEQKDRPGAKDRAESIATNDPILKVLVDKGMVKSEEKLGHYNIECPFANEHTTESGETSTAYFLPNYGGVRYGKFYCFHDHCAEREQEEFIRKLGLDPKKVWAQHRQAGEGVPNSATGESSNYYSDDPVEKSERVQASMDPPKTKSKSKKKTESENKKKENSDT
ncbi:MAG: hypothetical protein GY703_15265, partial [Gammaproteobacteria bacterium]|nr:hypothetical protein [Gammaproteobacteria bacterium]